MANVCSCALQQCRLLLTAMGPDCRHACSEQLHNLQKYRHIDTHGAFNGVLPPPPSPHGTAPRMLVTLHLQHWQQQQHHQQQPSSSNSGCECRHCCPQSCHCVLHGYCLWGPASICLLCPLPAHMPAHLFMWSVAHPRHTFSCSALYIVCPAFLAAPPCSALLAHLLCVCVCVFLCLCLSALCCRGVLLLASLVSAHACRQASLRPQAGRIRRSDQACVPQEGEGSRSHVTRVIV